MEETKKGLLESKGWKIGTVSDFLELTPEEIILVEIKLALPSVSLELLIRLLLATGATPQDIGQIIAGMNGVC